AASSWMSLVVSFSSVKTGDSVKWRRINQAAKVIKMENQKMIRQPQAKKVSSGINHCRAAKAKVITTVTAAAYIITVEDKRPCDLGRAVSVSSVTEPDCSAPAPSLCTNRMTKSKIGAKTPMVA